MLLLAVAVDMLSWPSSGVACANTLLSPPLLILEIIGTAVGMKLWFGCCADNNDSDNGGSNSARVSSWCSTLDVNGDGDGRVVPAESFFVVVSIIVSWRRRFSETLRVPSTQHWDGGQILNFF